MCHHEILSRLHQRALCTSARQASISKHIASNSSFLRSTHVPKYPTKPFHLVCARHAYFQIASQTILTSTHLEINRVHSRQQSNISMASLNQRNTQRRSRTQTLVSDRHQTAKRNPITLSRHCISPVLCHMNSRPSHVSRNKNCFHGKTR